MIERAALSPNPSPASGRGEQTNSVSGRAASARRREVQTNRVSGLPSPARGRGAGGEGGRLTGHKFAQALRSHQTSAEQRLWYFLRAHRFLGLKFKRQMPIGPYIADFVCMAYKVIVEADGGQHGKLSDFDRDVWLRAQGYTVLRFWNNQIHEEIEGVLETIRQALLANGLIERPTLCPERPPLALQEPKARSPLPHAGEGRGERASPANCRRVP